MELCFDKIVDTNFRAPVSSQRLNDWTDVDDEIF